MNETFYFGTYLESVARCATVAGVPLRKAFSAGGISKSTYYRTIKRQTNMRKETAEAIIKGIRRYELRRRKR